MNSAAVIIRRRQITEVLREAILHDDLNDLDKNAEC